MLAVKLDVVIVPVLAFTSVPAFPDSVSNTAGGAFSKSPGTNVVAWALTAKVRVTAKAEVRPAFRRRVVIIWVDLLSWLKICSRMKQLQCQLCGPYRIKANDTSSQQVSHFLTLS